MPSTEFNIVGDSAAITGAGRGIGKQIAERLAKAGVNVALNDLDAERLSDTVEELDRYQGRAIGIAGNASNPDDVAEFIESAVEAFDGLDILVNNVGIAGPTKSCENLSYEEFMNTLDVNLGGFFNASHTAIPHLREGDTGRIINLSSMTGKNPLPNRTPYCAAKIGVIGFTRSLALELAEDSINVNAICPGSVWGDRLERTYQRRADEAGKTLEEVKAESLEDAPLGEFVNPNDISNLVAFLCSAQADKITGQDINITAGKTMY